MSLASNLKSMAIAEILEKYPQTDTVFKKYGLSYYAKTETARLENLEASSLVHSIDLQSLLENLVKTIEG